MSRSSTSTGQNAWDTASVLSFLIHDFPDPIFALDESGLIVAANDAGLKVAGQSMESLSDTPLTSLLGPEFAREFEQASNAESADEPVRFRCAIQLQGGARSQTDVTILPERAGHSQVYAYVLLAPHSSRQYDEPDLAQMLNVSQGGLNAIFNSGASGIIFFDLDGKIIEANPAVQRMLDYDADELRGKNVLDLVHEPSGLAPATSQGDPFADLVAGTRNHFQAVRRFEHRDGHLVWAQVTVSAVHDEQGEIRYFISMMQDVTEHKLLEDVAVIANEAKASLEKALERIVEELAIQLGFQAAHVLLVHEQSARIVPTGIWYLAEPGMLPNFSELTKATTFAPGAGHVGRVLSSSVATLDRDLPHSADSLRIAAAIDDGLRTGLFVPMIIHNDVVGVIEFYSTEDRDVDPTLLETLTRIAPQLGWLIERERAKEALELKSAELERSNRDLERFASVASHDLQEPLRAIGRCTALLRDQYGDQFEEDAAQLFFFIADGVERMEALITDLLRYSRISTATVEHTLVDLDQVVRDVLQDLAVAIDENDAVITVSDLPVVRGSDTQLHQIFQNLIGNALKYRGQDPPRIRISVRASGSDWLFSIKDNGIGIDPVYHAQIFDIFRRLHARDQYTGTGIGLAIVKRIVEQHQGRLWVESTEGEGSTFFFTLPIPGGNGSHRDDRTA